MLSQPVPLLVSGAKISSSKSVLIYFKGYYELILSLQKSMSSSLVLHSQIPSHPINKKLSSLVKVVSVMSGFAIINYLSLVKDLLFLYSKSPIALDKFKFPFTLPSLTNPPASEILDLSI